MHFLLQYRICTAVIICYSKLCSPCTYQISLLRASLTLPMYINLMNFGNASTHFNFLKLNLQKKNHCFCSNTKKMYFLFSKMFKGISFNQFFYLFFFVFFALVSTVQLVYKPFHIKLSIEKMVKNINYPWKLKLKIFHGKEVIFPYYVYINISLAI